MYSMLVYSIYLGIVYTPLSLSLSIYLYLFIIPLIHSFIHVQRVQMFTMQHQSTTQYMSREQSNIKA